jgi:tetratricopeptide (TPR) repeat protein
VLARIGAELLALGHVAQARDHADRAEKATRKWLVEVAALTGQLAFHDNDLDEAGRLLRDVVTRAPQSPQARHAHLTLGLIAARRGDFTDADTHFDRALTGNEDRRLCLAVLRAKADAADVTGRSQDALDCLTKAADLADGTDDAPALALALGQMHADRGNVADAEPWLRDAVRSAKLGSEDHFAALRRLGDVADRRGNTDAAVRHLKAALTYAIDNLDVDRTVDAAAAYLDLLRRLGHDDDIDFALRTTFAAVAGEDAATARLLGIEADLRMNRNQVDRAKAAYTEARKLYRLRGDRPGEVRALIGLARTEKPEGNAVTSLQEAGRLVTGLRGPEADSLRRQIDDLRGW